MKALRGFGSVSGRPDHRPRSKRIVRKGFTPKIRGSSVQSLTGSKTKEV